MPSYLGWNRFDPFGYVGVAGSNNLVSGTPVGPIRSAFGTGANSTVRVSNSVGYFTPAGLAGSRAGRWCQQARAPRRPTGHKVIVAASAGPPAR
ncbi:MAG: hypothetical protein U1F25_08240 [Rubrivivax sp.]